MVFRRTVEAYQYFRDKSNDKFPKFMLDAFQNGNLFYGEESPDGTFDVYINTSSGVGMLLIDKDWIIPDGEGVERINDADFQRRYVEFIDSEYEAYSDTLEVEYELMEEVEDKCNSICNLLKQKGDPYLELRISDSGVQLIRVEQYLPMKED